MAVSSLRAQLNTLKNTPAAQAAKTTRRTPSFLFPGKDASEVELQACHQLGLNGLLELGKSNSKFLAYEETLFAPSSVELVREHLSAEQNAALDASLAELLELLGPHFLSRATPKVLEYLLRRYRVHEHNVDALVELGLPYHEHVLFGRLLALLADKRKWDWLHQAARAGPGVARAELVMRATRDGGELLRRLLRMCAGPSAASHAALQALQVAFVADLLAALSPADAASLALPALAAHIPPQLRAPQPERALPAVLLLTALVRRVALAPAVLTPLLQALARVPLSGKGPLPDAVLLCLLAACQTHPDAPLPPALLELLLALPALPAALARRAAEYDTAPLVRALLRLLAEAGLPSKRATDSAVLLTALAREPALMRGSGVAGALLRLAWAAFCAQPAQGEWLGKALRSLAACGPALLDSALAAQLPHMNAPAEQLTAFLALLQQPKYALHGGPAPLPLFVSLHHPDAAVRLAALEQLERVGAAGGEGANQAGAWLVERLSAEDQARVLARALAVRPPLPGLARAALPGLLLQPPPLLRAALAHVSLGAVSTSPAASNAAAGVSAASLAGLAEALLGSLLPNMLPLAAPADNAALLAPLLTLVAQPGPPGRTYTAQSLRAAELAAALLPRIHDELFAGAPAPAAASTEGRKGPALTNALHQPVGRVLKHGASQLAADPALLPLVAHTAQEAPALVPLLCALVATAQQEAEPSDALSESLLALLAMLAEQTGPLQAAAAAPEEASAEELGALASHGGTRLLLWAAGVLAPRLAGPAHAQRLLELLAGLPVAGGQAPHQALLEACMGRLAAGGPADQCLPQLLAVLRTQATRAMLPAASPAVQRGAATCLALAAALLRAIDTRASTSAVRGTAGWAAAGWLLGLLAAPHASVRHATLTTMQVLVTLLAAHDAAARTGSLRAVLSGLLEQRSELLADAAQLPRSLRGLLQPAASPDDESTDATPKRGRRTATPPAHDEVAVRLLETAQAELEAGEPRTEGAQLAQQALVAALAGVASARVQGAAAGLLQKLAAHADEPHALALAGLLGQQLEREALWPLLGSAPWVQALERALQSALAAVLLPHVKAALLLALPQEVRVRLCHALVALAEAPGAAAWQESARAHVKALLTQLAAALDGAGWAALLEKAARPVLLLEALGQALPPPAPAPAPARLELLLPPLFALLERLLERTPAAPDSPASVSSDGSRSAGAAAAADDPLDAYELQLLLRGLTAVTRTLAASAPTMAPHAAAFRVELIGRAIACSSNPAVQHESVELLGAIGGVLPEVLLAHIAPLFARLARASLRHDDTYSYRLLLQMIDRLVRLLVLPRPVPAGASRKRAAAGASGVAATEADADRSQAVLGAFVGQLANFPAHKRAHLFSALVQALGTAKLHLLLYLLLQTPGAAAAGVDVVALGTSVCGQLAPTDVLTAFSALLTEFLPQAGAAVREGAVRTMAGYLSSRPLVAAAAASPPAEQARLQAAYGVLIRQLLEHLEAPAASGGSAGDEKAGKDKDKAGKDKEKSAKDKEKAGKEKDKTARRERHARRAYAEACHDVVEKLLELQPLDAFVAGIGTTLLRHSHARIRHRALQLLNERLRDPSRLASAAGSREPADLVLPPLLPPLLQLLAPAEPAPNQQAALLCLEIVARAFAARQPTRFTDSLKLVITLLRASSPAVAAAAAMTLATYVGELGVAVLAHVPSFMPALLALLRPAEGAADDEHEVLAAAVLSSLQVLVAKLSAFVAPYVAPLLQAVCKPAVLEAAPALRERARQLLQSLPSALPPRNLLPQLFAAYRTVSAGGADSAACELLGVVEGALAALSKEDAKAQHVVALKFFLSVLAPLPAPRVLSAAVRAFVALVLKLSEALFKPVFLQLLAWARIGQPEPDPAASRAVYVLARALLAKLRGIFVPYVAYLLDDVLARLERVAPSAPAPSAKDAKRAKTAAAPAAGELAKLDGAGEQETWEEVLSLLGETLSCDADSAATALGGAERLARLSGPLVSQLRLASRPALVPRVHGLVLPALASLAAAMGNDAQWKPLNHALLLATRDSSPAVRQAAVQALNGLYQRLGEEYLVLLPESIPYLAELVEDPNPLVEKHARDLVATIDSLTGEQSIQQYFSR